jgi:hypothetical protein
VFDPCFALPFRWKAYGHSLKLLHLNRPYKRFRLRLWFGFRPAGDIEIYPESD